MCNFEGGTVAKQKESQHVAFDALIKEFSVKSLVSLDKEAKLILIFPGADVNLLNKINVLHKADETVHVSIEVDRG